MKHLLSLLLISISIQMYCQRTIEFPSGDGLLITADFYEAKNASKFIILYHQAGWSRGEYKEIAPKLVALGYSCLAVDQRSGGSVNDIENQTHKRAAAAEKKTKYIDAYPDIEAAVSYVKKVYTPEKLFIWGSSYSSSLVLKYAGDHPNTVDAVLSFSPGEYYEKKDLITSSAAKISVPVFITSAKKEQKSWSGIYDAIPTDTKQFFLPETDGNHGSRALWEKFSDHQSYWIAVQEFLKTI